MPSALRSLLRKTDAPTRAQFANLLDAAILKAEKAARQAATRRQRDPMRDAIEDDQKACTSFYEFVKRSWHVLEPVQRYVDNWHIKLICDVLQAVTEGKVNRVLINVPPGSMKSMLVSVTWPAWEWAMGHRSYRYIVSSFEESNCDRDTRRMRDLIISEWYQARWPDVHLVRKGDSAISNTDTGYRESSAFGSLTNKRGDRLIIDDPHSVKTAESDVQRSSAVTLFREGALNRLNDQEKSAIVVIMQRLHDHDISGTIIALQMGFLHVMLPAEFEIKRRCVTPFGRDPRTIEGELLDPVRLPRTALQKLAKGMGAHAYAGQYQQRPTAREGGLFKRAWFEGKIVPMVKFERGERVRSVRRWDLAGTKPHKNNTDPDWTVGLKMTAVGADEDTRFYIEDVNRFRDSPLEVRQSVKATALIDGKQTKIVIPEDAGQAGKDQVRSYIARMAGYDIRAEREAGMGDKGTRAEPFAAQLEAGNVFLLDGDWNETFIEELCIAEGTLISTFRGDIRVEDVRPGDMAMTRLGWRRVTDAKCTSERATLCQMKLSNGSSLSCTLNHPILVGGSNFKKAGHVAAGDRLLRYTGAMSSSSRLGSENDISKEWSTERPKTSIGTSGSKSVELSRPDITSTMLMTIAGTMTSRILSAFQRQSIRAAIENGKFLGGSLIKAALFAARPIRLLRARGQRPVRENVLESARLSSGINGFITALVRNVVCPLTAPIPASGFAAGHAAPRANPERMPSPGGRAFNAVPSLSLAPARADFAADVAVSSLRMLSGEHRVYNLEVEEVHEYVANGVVVHNCAFPKGHDDQVDAASGAFRELVVDDDGTHDMDLSQGSLTRDNPWKVR